MSKPRHADKDSAPTSSGPKQIHHLSNYIFLFLLAVFLIAVYTFLLQKSYSTSTLEANVDQNITCSDAIHKLVSNTFTRDDFTDINTVDNMSSERYQTLQTTLNQIRSLNSTRYLYTAKRNSEGKLIYLVDGLDLDTSDFAYPGTYIEDEMIPYINSALSGKTIYSQEIIDTTWGHIFTACYPVKATDGSNEIIGALCIEMDMESAYTFLSKSSRNSLQIAIAAAIVALLLLVCVYHILQNQRAKDREQQMLLRKSAAAAEAANKAKSAFLFNMSHDIRTPMNAIIGYAELSRNHLHEPDKLSEYLSDIRTCGQKMLSIIDNILEIARIENNQIVLEESICNIEESFDSCIVMFNTAVQEKHQTITVHKQVANPYVYIDSSHLSEIVLNVISNAIKYTGQNGKIDCCLTQKPHEDADWCYMEISIADNGIGMSEEFQAHIFESFSREHSSTISGIEGTGLGMGIVKNLVDLMHGMIEIQSSPGKGSTFTICIPCRTARKEEAEPRKSSSDHPQKTLAGKRILLAEDNDLNAEIAIELLSEEGLLVDRVSNGVACVEKLEKAAPDFYDLILMDIQMPVMNGYDATRKIRQLEDPFRSSIPIIAMTANAFAEDRQKALFVGMNDHVAKPVDMNVLIPVLEKHIRTKKEN
ncbi:hybrid sensor histidine kinase/response regulator [Blautia intestinihominis]|jgi:signal transduction histidine kinase/BarA-like signal transduction histidine kinase|uniref:Stage 0 sporulation protein A homolog n=1 Tax=Blautia intestinihominis TaxID=3133152 RepID=A0ABV1ALQ3_9FIRM